MNAAPAEAPAPTLDIRLRAAVLEDTSYILAKFRESWKLSRSNRRLSRPAYNAMFDDLVGAILGQPDTAVIVACDAGDPGTILGWICYTPGIPTVHYAYVRRRYRQAGIFRLLISTIGIADWGALAYTFRPRERSHPQGRDLGLEDALVEAAMRRQITVRYVSPQSFLGRTRRP